MPASTAPATATVALIGNPNTGKSTLFSALVGVHQHVGNYPGVTVEKKTGRLDHGGRRYELIDLPGLYSLAPRSRDEMVAVDVLLGRYEDTPRADAVVCILDAANLERNLYLAGQVLELGLPTVVAVNMLDVAARHGMTLDLKRLQERLGVRVVAIQANRGLGLDELRAALAETMDRGRTAAAVVFPQPFEEEVSRLEPLLPPASTPWSRGLVRRLLLDTSGYLQEALLSESNGQVENHLHAARRRLAQVGCAVPGIETEARYRWARQVLEGIVTAPGRSPPTATDRIDRLLTHRVWGMLCFAALMLVVFQAVFVWAEPLKHGIDAATAAAGRLLEQTMAEGALRSLLVDGVLGGVGSVLGFLPQILVLFFFIAVLEDCGYMARAAYLMDRVMARVGLSGRSFLPMLSSFACTVPAVMAARVIENERDRLTTILVSPLLTCSARLPVYTLLIAAFIPGEMYLGRLFNLQGLTLAALYALGILAAVAVALVLKRTLLRGGTPPFLMELPSYKWPSPRTIALRVGERGWIFLRAAGTLILAMSVLVWAVSYYPHGPRGQQPSILASAGRAIEPAVRPLGWDWRIGCAVIASLPARELVVANLGVIYNLDPDLDVHSGEGADRLKAELRSVTWEGTNRPVFTVPVALSIMVFFALCGQCVATLAVIRRETSSWRWPAFTFTYMSVLAYVGALLTYQVGTWIAG